MNRFRIKTYNVGIIRKDIKLILEVGIKKGDIIWMKHNYKDRFFADPFLIKEDDNFFYIVCEELLFFEKNGKITLLVVRKTDFKLISRRVIIEESTHLSFPFCELNESYIIPESASSGKTKKYYFDSDFNIIKEEIICNQGLIDNVYFNYSDKDIMIATLSDSTADGYQIFIENGDRKYVPFGERCYDGPDRSRGAGHIFKIDGDKSLYRPVQDCSIYYGRETKILKIDSIDFNLKKIDYSVISIVNSFENKPFSESLHTFNVYDNCIIVDGSKDYFRPFSKIAYKKMPFLFRRRTEDEKRKDSKNH